MLNTISNIQQTNLISQKQLGRKTSNTQSANINQTQLVSYQGAQALKSAVLASVSFKGNDEGYFWSNDGIGITDLFKVNQEKPVIIPHDKDLNPDGPLMAVKFARQDKEKVIVTDINNKQVAVVSRDTDCYKVPKATFKRGKYQPTVEIKRPNGLKLILTGGSEIEADKFNIKLPGVVDIPGKDLSKVSFAGNKYITTFYKEDQTVKTTKNYDNSDLVKQVTKGDFADEFDANIGVSAGGMGTRAQNWTGENNKPSATLPADDNYRLMSNTLERSASAGVNGKTVFLSEAGSIEGDDVISINPYRKALGDAGSYAEAVDKGIIDSNKALVVLNADTFTNADISRTYKEFKELPDAAIMIPFYPIEEDRISSFGVICAKKDENGKPMVDEKGNVVVSEFVEKPKKFSAERIKAEAGKIGDSDEFMTNPGIYILGKDVVEELGKRAGQKINFGPQFVPEIVKLCNEGKLVGKNGQPLKVYTRIMEAKGGKPAIWDDLGTMEAVNKRLKHIAYETKNADSYETNPYHGIAAPVLEQIAENVDLETGVICESREAKQELQNFMKEFGIKGIKGNAYVKIEKE